MSKQIEIKNEIWKDIVGYEGLYFVSNMGNVKSWYINGRFLKARKDSEGYTYVSLYKNKKSTNFKLHRLVATHFIPNPYNKSEVNHKKGIRHDNRVSELEWCTRKENEEHAVRIGLKNRKGENSLVAKLKNEDVIYIRNCGKSNSELSKIYNISKNHVCGIKNRRSWKHI